MNHVKTLVGAAVAAAMLSMAGAALAQKGETVKIGWVDPLSGLMAPVGQNQIKSYQYMAEQFSKSNSAGVKFEMVLVRQQAQSPQETVNARASR
jgi:branched-chain amino acid transport system substrate-binding protein